MKRRSKAVRKLCELYVRKKVDILASLPIFLYEFLALRNLDQPNARFANLLLGWLGSVAV